MKKRFNVTIDEDLIKQIDEAAEKLGQSRSSFLSMAAATYIQTNTAINLLPGLIDAYRKSEQAEK